MYVYVCIAATAGTPLRLIVTGQSLTQYTHSFRARTPATHTQSGVLFLEANNKLILPMYIFQQVVVINGERMYSSEDGAMRLGLPRSLEDGQFVLLPLSWQEVR